MQCSWLRTAPQIVERVRAALACTRPVAPAAANNVVWVSTPALEAAERREGATQTADVGGDAARADGGVSGHGTREREIGGHEMSSVCMYSTAAFGGIDLDTGPGQKVVMAFVAFLAGMYAWSMTQYVWQALFLFMCLVIW